MATKKHKVWGKVKSHKRRIKGVFGIAASDKAYKRAKKTAERAAKKASMMWKKAQVKARKKVKALSKRKR